MNGNKLAEEYEGYLRNELRVAESTTATYAAEARRFGCWLDESGLDAVQVKGVNLEAYVAGRGDSAPPERENHIQDIQFSPVLLRIYADRRISQ